MARMKRISDDEARFIESGYEAAKASFRYVPNKYNSGIYLKMLMEAEAADLISDDEWLDGLAEIRDFLCVK